MKTWRISFLGGTAITIDNMRSTTGKDSDTFLGVQVLPLHPWLFRRLHLRESGGWRVKDDAN